jgi:uncharacterized protein (TIRG00374 family)
LTKEIFKHLKRFLPFIGIILLIIYVLLEEDIELIMDSFLSIHPLYIIYALLLTIPRVLVRNIAWQMILKEQKINISFIKSLKIFLIGYFYGSFTPGYMGQLMRIPYLKEKTNEPYGKLFINSTIETTVHTVSIYIIIFIGSIIILEKFPELFIIVIIWLSILSGTVIYFINKKRGEKLLFGFVKYLIPKKFKSNSKQFVKTFYKDFPKIYRLIPPIIIGAITWIIIFSQEYLFVIALDVQIPYIYFLLFFPIANAAGFIPITFAGLGTRELTAVAIFTTLFPEVISEKILVVSLMGFIITDLCTGFIGFLLSLTETVKRIQ